MGGRSYLHELDPLTPDDVREFDVEAFAGFRVAPVHPDRVRAAMNWVPTTPKSATGSSVFSSALYVGRSFLSFL